MRNPSEFIDKMTNAPPHERENLIEREFPADALESYLPKDSPTGTLLGYSVSDIVIDGRTISANFFLLYTGEVYSDPDGQYQDDDGENYDFPEREYFLSLSISDDGVAHELG
jgi:hypothetical protein